MTEKLLQYIWQFQQFNRQQLQTTAGEEIQIIAPGQLNTHQGPDFLQAKIKIGNTLLAGAIELHVHTSEWQKHGHSRDTNYKNVILHVVYQHDFSGNENLPVLELQPRIASLLLDQYNGLMNHQAFIACAPSIQNTKELTWISWKERLLAERMIRKSSAILDLLRQSNEHWEEVFWWQIARNFGAKQNSDAFEAIARSLPVNILAKHKNSIQVLEALLLGQAGLLENDFTDDYAKLLQREYHFYKKKYRLQPIHQPIHFLRMRPGNFPTIRLAQLAMLIHQSEHLFSKIKEATAVGEIKNWLSVTANDFWHYHYRIEEASEYKPKRVGADMVNNIIINTIVPIVFAYGQHQNQENYKTKALTWLEALSCETNNITTGFKSLSISSNNAYDSQAFIELKTQYCDQRKCLSCSIGNALLRRNQSA